MREATIERLSKLVSDTPTKDDGPGDKSHKPLLEMHLGLAEGWFSLILLTIVVYSTIWSVQAVGWVDHLGILSMTSGLGLVAGVLAAKQHRLSRYLLHVGAFVFGLLLAFWQASGAFYQGNSAAFISGIQHWIASISVGGLGDVDAVFFFFIVALSFLLAYTSAWLVYRTRSPWLMIGANAVVLLINLNNVSEGYIAFLVIFLIASLLLLLRFNLYESMHRWHKQGLRYAEDLGWDMMQAGALLSIGILIFSWVLPGSYMNPTLAQIWGANDNPWTQVQNTWNRVISITGGSNPANRGNFRNTMVLGGNPNLTHEVVFTVQTASPKDAGQYQVSLSYDTYTGQEWTESVGPKSAIKANTSIPPATALTHTITQKVTVVNPPGEQYPYLLGPPDISSISLPAYVQQNLSGSIDAWLGQNGYLVAGSKYTVVATASSADVSTLRSILMPKDVPPLPPSYEGSMVPVTYYDPGILSSYTQVPAGLDPRIAATAQRETSGGKTMYDKVVALQNWLSTNYSYNVDIHRPAGVEGVSWFLFQNPNRDGFCNYFASAMALMARSLGIPARVVVGYAPGTYDAKTNQNTILGTDAHSWTQVYFAGYGWINFEPSPKFAGFPIPITNPNSVTGTNSAAGGSGNTAVTTVPKHQQLDRTDGGSGVNGGTANAILAGPPLGMALGGFILLLLLLLLSFSLWWRRLFRHYGPAMQLYGRVCMLASWAGIRLDQSQTPYESMQVIALSAPKDAETLERLGDIYVRDRWADPESKEHPRRSGEIAQLPDMWKYLQPHLFIHVLRHPHFLRWLPVKIGSSLRSFLKRRKAKRVPDIEDL